MGEIVLSKTKILRLFVVSILLLLGEIFAYPTYVHASGFTESAEGSARVQDDVELRENSWRYQNGSPINLENDSVELFSMGGLPSGSTAQGIDVSSHNGTIDWDAVKASGVDYAILRIGYGDMRYGAYDRQWQRNVAECERVGIAWGAYLYSYASNTNYASGEADRVISALNGLDPDLPIYYDMEDKAMDGSDYAALAATFCNKVEAAGYKVGVYASKTWWETRLTDPIFGNWEKWVAQWNSECTYTGSYTMWQYTSRGSVPGISGNVDMNYWFGGPIGELGWSYENGNWYYKDVDGSYRTGWVRSGVAWYWLDPETGAMATGLVRLGDAAYYLDPLDGGAMASSRWVQVDGAWYLASTGGSLYSGWKLVGGLWYWFDPATFAMVTGPAEIGGVDYILGPSGVLTAGWAQVGGSWYYGDAAGRLVTGWVKPSGAWYWLDPETGAMATGLVRLGDAAYYLDPLDGGAMASSRWVQVDGVSYWADESGRLIEAVA